MDAPAAAARGDDPDSIISGDGPKWRLRYLLLIWAAVALDEGLSLRQTYVLAGDLGVTPQELTAAYGPEMRNRAMAAILGHQDLAALDVARRGPGGSLHGLWPATP